MAAVCAAYALAWREPYGTWGGMSEADREARYPELDPVEASAGYRAALAAWQRRAGMAGAGPGQPERVMSSLAVWCRNSSGTCSSVGGRDQPGQVGGAQPARSRPRPARRGAAAPRARPGVW